MRFHLWRSLGEGLGIIVTAWVLVFLVHVIHEPYSRFKSVSEQRDNLEILNKSLSVGAEGLKKKLEETQNTRRPSAPSGKNVVGKISGGSNIVGDVKINPEVNPNKAAVVYNCVGMRVSIGPTDTATFSITESGSTQTRTAYKDMLAMYQSKRYSDLLAACNAQLESTPEWLTPYLLCGLGHLALNNREKAHETLKSYEDKVGTGYGDGECSRMADFIRAQVKQR